MKFDQWIRPGSRLRYFTPLLLAGVILCAIGVYADQLHQHNRIQKLRHNVLDHASVIRARLEGHVSSSAQLVQGLVAYVSNNPDLTQKQFHAIARLLFTNNPHLRNIGLAPGLVIRYIYPVKGNEKAIGLDYRKHPAQLQAVLRARDLGKLILAGPVNLVQGGRGFIARVPVFLPSQNNSTRKFWGMISVVISSDGIYKSAGLYNTKLKLRIALRGKDGLGSKGNVFYGESRIFNQEPVLVNITLPVGSWQMAAIPINGWARSGTTTFLFRLILVNVILLMMGLFYILARSSQRNHETSSRLQGLFDLSPLGICLTDYESGRFIDTNQAMSNATGYTQAELALLTFVDLTPDKHREQDRVHFASLVQTGRYGPYEKEIKRKDGTRYPVVVNGMVMHDADGNKRIWSIVEDITERKSARAALADSKEQLELVIDATAVGIWDWEVQTGKTEFNERWAEIIGYTLSELEPINIDTWLKHAHPDDLNISGKKLEAHWNGETERYVCEARMRHKDGHWVWVLDTGRTVEWQEDGKPKRMIGTHLDITEAKLAENALQKSREQYQHLVENIGDNFVIYQHEALTGKLLYVSNGMLNLFGLDKEETIGQPWQELINWEPDTLERANLNVEEMVSGKRDFAQFEMSYTHPDGSQRTIHVSCHPVKDDSGTVATIEGIVEDITRRKKSEQELIIARDEAEHANRAKSDFLSSMSHELRTPMNAILGFSQLLLMEKLSEKQRLNITEIYKAGEHLLELINDVLDLSRVEAGRVELNLEPVEVHPVLMDCLKLVATLAEKKNISINYNEQPGQAVTADRIRLKQALLNLATNAIKYNNENGSVTISIEPGDNKQTRVYVKDTGPGIDKDKIPQLFEPFNRLGAENTNVEGTGIGLTLTRRMVTMMDGKVGVESDPGKGSTFWIELPTTALPTSNTAPVDTVAPGGRKSTANTNSNRCKVLYIEDNPANLKLVSGILSSTKSVNLVTSHSAELGMEMIQESIPDLVLLDINLPGMDGFEFLKKLKADETTTDIPVIAITANAMPREIQRGKDAGFSAYLTKPLDVNHFLKVFNQFLCSECEDC